MAFSYLPPSLLVFHRFIYSCRAWVAFSPSVHVFSFPFYLKAFLWWTSVILLLLFCIDPGIKAYPYLLFHPRSCFNPSNPLFALRDTIPRGLALLFIFLNIFLVIVYTFVFPPLGSDFILRYWSFFLAVSREVTLIILRPVYPFLFSFKAGCMVLWLLFFL